MEIINTNVKMFHSLDKQVDHPEASQGECFPLQGS